MAISEIKENLKTKRLVLGTDLTIKHLKRGSVAKVFLSSNCPETAKQDIDHYSGITKLPVENLPVPNSELGTICKKPFPVSVVGLLKQ